MANSVLPEELMLCILSRLPVKTIVRFKSVCKPWFHLFSTPEFKKMHQAQFSSDPKNQSIIAQSFKKFYIINIESGKKRPLDHPFAHAQTIYSYTVGCCNGLVCILKGQEIVLWNPVMKLSKTFPLKDCGPNKMVSLGFGYDAIGDDFKVVMIVTSRDGDPIKFTSAEIYSANSDSWITIDVGFHFSWRQAINDLIVNGNPYWVARIDGNETLLCFDVLELVFKFVPRPKKTDLDGYTKTVNETYLDLGDCNGALGAYIINYEYRNASSRIGCVWVLMFDDIEQIWRKIHTFGPIETDVYMGRALLFIKNAKILGFYQLHKLCVLDLETGCIKELFGPVHIGNFFEFYGYTESLAHISGMENCW
ncbi:hypothetical protein CASFOL_013229 [Castilleja foliolosa]|uniref:F-box domain-containing protein n=1 Tax=Castilleja foliolosa TaxID=1961234 RepID=A0ABD3DN93_9LAMI